MDWAKIGTDLVTGLGSSLINPIGDAISGLFGRSEMQKYQKQADINLAYQKNLIDYQNENTKELTQHMWKNYQSPQAIMSAYKASGINPNLVAGKISGSGTALQSAGGNVSGASYQANRFDPTLLSQLSYQREQTEYQKLKNEEQKLLNDKLASEKPYFEQNAANQAKALALGNDLTSKEIDGIVAEINLKAVVSNLNAVMSQKEAILMGNLLVERSFLAASIEEKQARVKEIYENIENGKMTYLLLQANKKFVEAQEKTEGKKLDHLVQMIDNLKTEDEINKLDREKLAKALGWEDWRQAKDNIVDPLLDVAGLVLTGATASSPKVSSTTTRTTRSKSGTTTHTTYNY